MLTLLQTQACFVIPVTTSCASNTREIWCQPPDLHFFIEESESESEVAQSCPTLCDPMDCSLPGSSLHGILQARVLIWVSISFSRESSQPKDQTWVSCIPGKCFNLWATRVAYSFSRESSPPRNWTRVSFIAGWFFISWANLQTDI